jgi:S1-C subfamily serine protease
MSRKGRLIVAGTCGALLAALILLFLFILRDDAWRPKTLGGPVAVFKGTPPKYGFLGIDFGGATAAPLAIQRVLTGSGAADAGLQPGDVVLAAGTAVRPDRAALHRVLQATAPGEQLLLRIGRGQDELQVKVSLIRFADIVVLCERSAYLGVGFGQSTTAPLTIHRVLKGSGAADAGLQPGDVILAAGKTKNPDWFELQRLLQGSAAGEQLPLKIGRDSNEIEVQVKLISYMDATALGGHSGLLPD